LAHTFFVSIDFLGVSAEIVLFKKFFSNGSLEIVLFKNGIVIYCLFRLVMTGHLNLINQLSQREKQKGETGRNI